MPAAFVQARPDGVYLAVKVQPRASRTEIDGPLGNELKIKVTAPPVDAAANQALVDLLAETLDCSRGAVSIVRGRSSRRKTVRITGMDAETVLCRLTGGARCRHDGAG
ncbi:MAG: DUF167 domain-containing protein [Verrucomicrobiota bacterium]|jgi:uncharacterized protein (TIGR00251 family)